MNSIAALDVAIRHMTSSGPIVNGANAFEAAITTLVALRDMLAEDCRHTDVSRPTEARPTFLCNLCGAAL